MVNRNMYNTSLWLLHIHVSLLLMFEKRRLKQLSFDFTWEICHLLDITAVAGHLAWLAVLFSVAIDPIHFKFIGNNDMHIILNEFEFRPDRTTNYGVTCPWTSKKYPHRLIMGKMVSPLFMPRHQKVAGYYVIPSEILSVRPSVRPSVRQRPPPFLYRQLLLQF